MRRLLGLICAASIILCSSCSSSDSDGGDSGSDNSVPVFSTGGNLKVIEQSRPENDVLVVDLEATDQDGDDLIYYITGGSDYLHFRVNYQSGMVEFIEAPNYENPTDDDGDNRYEVEVSVTDGTASDSKLIRLSIDDVNESPALVAISDPEMLTWDSVENETEVVQVEAVDEDSSVLSFSIVGGEDQSYFTINGGSGLLSFKQAPNYESAADANGDNVYELLVQVSDGNSADQLPARVTVQDLTDEPMGSMVLEHMRVKLDERLIQLMVKLEDKDAIPVGGKEIQDFIIEENDVPVVPAEGMQRLSDISSDYTNFTLFCVDLSGSVQANTSSLEAIETALELSVEEIMAVDGQQVGIAYFSDTFHWLVPFTADKATLLLNVELISDINTDVSSNLHGAIVTSLDQLDLVKRASSATIKDTNLVLITDGYDQSGLVTRSEVDDRLDGDPTRIHAIGIQQGGLNEELLSAVGSAGFHILSGYSELGPVCSDIAVGISEQSGGYYLIEYITQKIDYRHGVTVSTMVDDHEVELAVPIDMAGAGASPQLSVSNVDGYLPPRFIARDGDLTVQCVHLVLCHRRIRFGL